MKEFAIKENHLFVKAYTKGERFVTPTVSVYKLRDLRAAKLKKENPQKEFLNRIGFSVSKKLGNAVTRNRAKRVMRAGYRAVADGYELKTGNLIVIAARERAALSSSSEVEKDIKTAFLRLDLIKRERSSTDPVR